jgi:hypothetical protein
MVAATSVVGGLSGSAFSATVKPKTVTVNAFVACSPAQHVCPAAPASNPLASVAVSRSAVTLKYTAGSGHYCGAFMVVLVDGKVAATTGDVDANQTSSVAFSVPVDGKVHAVSYRIGSNDGDATKGCTTLIGSAAGPTSMTYYPKSPIPRKMGIIQGRVMNRDGGPVAGTLVRAFANSRLKDSGTSGSDGYYELQVPKGAYQVVPSGGPLGKKGPAYKPAFKTVAVNAGKYSQADFTLAAGLEVKMTLSAASVPADGLQTVKGTIETFEYGKPKPGAKVRLSPQPTIKPDIAVTTAPHGTICSGGSRLWPTGTLSAPNGGPVDITTGPGGRYGFTVLVGTIPGAWSLDAWGFTSDGHLSSDVLDASETATVNLTSLGSVPPISFVQGLNGLVPQGSTAATRIRSGFQDTAAMQTTLSGLASSEANRFGGLAFAEGTTDHGPVLIVYSAATPPSIDATGLVSMSNAPRIIDPGLWLGTGLASSVVNPTVLAEVVGQGALPDIPNYDAWRSGTTIIPAWKAAPAGSQIKVPPNSFSAYGWAYPNSTVPCA